MADEKTIDLIGVGSPVVDTLARVSEAFLDEVPGDKGGMELVDSDALKALADKLGDSGEDAAGGSSGNTTFAAGRLGLRTAFLGTLGNDHYGAFYLNRFVEIEADVTRFKQANQPNGRCISLVTPDSERTMRTDLGAAMTLSPEEVSEADFSGCRHAHIEGYLLFNRDLMRKVLDCAKAAGCTVSVDLASFEVVKAASDVLETWLRDGVDIVFANEDEASALFPDLGSDYEAMARKLAGLCIVGVVKLGKDGSLIAKGEELHRIGADVVKAVDTTGAGDYWAGGFLYGYLRGKDLPTCGKYGSMLGAEVVQVIGASLPETRWEALVAMVG